ncbi:MAG: DNA cytosine methyltransferase [Desulfovibrionales bacterium]|nr:DNA cytosine methyltransferase [Desulfovibrionales bacterium]
METAHKFDSIHTSHLKAIDFFCGIGGMTNGLLQAGINVVGGIDFDAECEETYNLNNYPSKFLHADIEMLEPADLSKNFGITPNDGNLVFVGCSPCQYWSKIRTNKQKSFKSAFLLKEFERFIEHFLPAYVVLENVPGLKNNPQSYLPTFLEFLKKHNYVFEQKVLNAKGYGVPQSRKRFLLIASRCHEEVSLPEASNDVLTVRDVLGVENGFESITAGHKDLTSFMHSSAGLSPQNLKRIMLTLPDGGNRMAWKDTELQIPAYVGKDNYFSDVYGRMWWDRPAPTITTKFPSFSNGRFGHPSEHRAISLREGATLQSFPKSFDFVCRKQGAVARQIGNAVPPALAKKIGEHLVKLNKMSSQELS